MTAAWFCETWTMVKPLNEITLEDTGRGESVAVTLPSIRTTHDCAFRPMILPTSYAEESWGIDRVGEERSGDHRG